MKLVCSWCDGEIIRNDSPESSSDGVITHGICDNCADLALWPNRPKMEDFLDRLAVPVLVINSSGTVSSANKYARDLLQKELSEIEELPGGIVFECVFARLPEGCGKTLHCDGCTIRNAVMDTFQSGRSHVRTPAGLTRGTSEEKHEMQFLISTEMLRDIVLLRIDHVTPMLAPPCNA